MQLIDTHAHLDFESYDKDREEVIRSAKEAGVFKIINIGSSLDGCKKGIELANKYEEVYATVGIHPEAADELTDETLEFFKKSIVNKKVVAIGEIGLDYYIESFPREQQKEIFIKQLDFAIKNNMPIIVHMRNAFPEMMEILEKYDWHKNKGVVHCYSSSYKKVKKILEMGLYISFTGIVTYDQGTQKAASEVPLERMMLETDSPFLAPEPYRGGRAEPKHVLEVAKKIAEIKEESLENVVKITTQNALNFFNIS